jgi:hypothetical protein
MVTQIAATILIAARIYAASQPYRAAEDTPEDGYEMGVVIGGGKKEMGGRRYACTQRDKYMAVVWIVVESGAIYSSAAIVQLVTYLEKMNAGVIIEFLSSQLSVSVFFLNYCSFCLAHLSSLFSIGNVSIKIVVHVGLGLAYEGASSTPYHHGGDHHDSSSSRPSFICWNTVQLSTFQAASRHDDTREQVSYLEVFYSE